MKTLTIAIVEDHDLLRNELASILEKNGLHITFMAENGAAALEKMALAQPLPDVCLMDISMPIMNGYELAGRLRETYPQVRVLAFSMVASQQEINKIISSGAHAFIPKGISIIRLQEAIWDVYNNKVG